MLTSATEHQPRALAAAALRRAAAYRHAIGFVAVVLAASLGVSTQLSVPPAIVSPAAGNAVAAVATVPATYPSLEQARAEARALQAAGREPTPLHALPYVESAAFQAALDRALAKFELPGVSFAVIRPDHGAWAGGSGRTLDGGAAAGDTRYVIGSVTKTFVATLTLELVEEGRLSLDARVADLLPGSGIDPAITVQQLLHHSSGLGDLFYPIVDRLLDEPDRGWTPAEVVAAAAAAGDPWFKPGAAWAYSNTNYVLLGMVLEKICGRPLADEIELRYLRPLRLEATRAEWTADGDPALLERSWATSFGASGAMSGTATDLARWGLALYGGDVLQPESLAKMLSFDKHDYGLGALRMALDGRVGVGHTGLLRYYSTAMLWFPDEEVVVTVMTNRAPFDPYEVLIHRDEGRASLLDLALGVEPPRVEQPQLIDGRLRFVDRD